MSLSENKNMRVVNPDKNFVFANSVKQNRNATVFLFFNVKINKGDGDTLGDF